MRSSPSSSTAIIHTADCFLPKRCSPGYTLDQVRAFHRDHFTAGRARLYIAGVFDAAAMEAAVRKAFDGWAKVRRRARRRKPAPRTGGFALIDRAGAPQSTVMLGLRVPDPSHADWVALAGHRLASRRLVRLPHHREHPGAEGLHVFARQSIDTHPGVASWVETADVTTNVTGPSFKEIFFEIDRLRKEAPPRRRAAGDQEQPRRGVRGAERDRAAASSVSWPSSTGTALATSTSRAT